VRRFNADCPLCLSQAAEAFFEEAGRLYFSCSRCGLKFLDPSGRPSPEEERARYLLHQNDVSDEGYRGFVKPLHDAIAGRVSRGGEGLDFGAGPGPVPADMLARSGYEVRLFDPFFHPNEALLGRRYDFVVACEVVEHLHDPAAEFKKLRGLLSPGGLLAVKTALHGPGTDFSRWHYRRDPTHVAFYSRKSFMWVRDRHAFAAVEFPAPDVILLTA